MTQEKPIRVLIADDHPVVREGLCSLVRITPGMELAGEAIDGIEAIEKVRALQPDVLLLDMVMPHKDGLEVIYEIKEGDLKTHVLVLTSFAEDDRVLQAIKAGALGYLLKDASPEMLLQAIRDVSQGESSLHPTVARTVIRELSRPTERSPEGELLTKREIEVLQLMAQGLSNQTIAEQLVIATGTVRIHVSNILSKLHLDNRVQAVLYALREGLVKPD